MSAGPSRLAQALFAPRAVALFGASGDPKKNTSRPQRFLRKHGYAGRIFPINPQREEVLGEKAYPSLRDVPEQVDIVQIFRRSEDVPPVVDEAIAIGAPVVWMQTGIVNEEAAARAKAAGLTVVMDACLRSAHRAVKAAGRL